MSLRLLLEVAGVERNVVTHKRLQEIISVPKLFLASVLNLALAFVCDERERDRMREVDGQTQAQACKHTGTGEHHIPRRQAEARIH